MLRPIQRRISLEIDKYRLLTPQARNLTMSYFVQSASNPIIGTFMNAYIWRIEGDFLSVVLFNLGNFIGLPLTFFLNGFLLKFLNIGFLYTLGSVFLGMGVMIVVFLSRLGVTNYLLFGLIYGVGYGLYWSNRNFLTLRQTESANRNYFTGLNFTLETSTSILMPFLLGWFIYYGRFYGIDAYFINAILAFLLLLLSGILVIKGRYKSPEIGRHLVKKHSPEWNSARLIALSAGVVDGMSFFIVSLLVLERVANEGILGTMDSIVSVVLGILFYYYGRKAGVNHQRLTYLISVIVGVIGSIFLTFESGSVYNILGFSSLYYFSISFMWLTIEPISMDITDREIGERHENFYSYVFDRELFLNIGRWISIFIFTFLLTVWGKNVSLHFSPLISYIFALLVAIYLWRKLKYVSK